MNKILAFFCFLILFSCKQPASTPSSTAPKLTALPSPATDNGEPNFFTSEDGEVYLSWIKRRPDTSVVLQFSRLEGDAWTVPQDIAAGKNWFVNWADFPSLVVKKGGKEMAAHWLQKRAAGTYDYDVRVAQSADGGKTWSASFIPHTDGVAAEHGFVSMLPAAGRTFATWLDGRHTKTGDHDTGHDDHGHGHGGGPMTLRTAEFDAEGKLFDEAELDARVCDCCQTDAAMTADGPIVVYRDRSETEVRDIFIVRKKGNEWTAPKAVFTDNWQIEGCPVNGPSVAAMGKQVVVGWYSEAKEEPTVKLAFSDDAGASFGTPIRLDGGNPLGRIAVLLLDENRAFACWLEENGEKGELRGAFVGTGGMEGKSILLAEMDAARSSGFPVLAQENGKVLVAWRDVATKGVKVIRLD